MFFIINRLQEAITSIAGEYVNINGDLISNTSIRIDGKSNGNVTAQKLIIVGKNAEIKGFKLPRMLLSSEINRETLPQRSSN